MLAIKSHMVESANLIHIMSFQPKVALPSLAGSRKKHTLLMSDGGSELGAGYGYGPMGLEGMDAASRRISINMIN